MTEALWPYQREAVDQIVARKRILLGDDVGLGKTVQALAAIVKANSFPAVVVCRAFLLPQWVRMAQRWLPILDSRSQYPPAILWLDNGMGFRIDTRRFVCIVNYESLTERQERKPPAPGFSFDVGPKKRRKMVLSKTASDLIALHPNMIVIDESSYVKNAKTDRTKACKTIAKYCDYRLLLSATPVENSPRELVSQLEILGRLGDFDGNWNFLQRYTGAHKNDWGFWDFSGASNLGELFTKLRASCFIRRTKDQVQQYLPEFRRETVTLPISNREEYDKAKADVVSWILAHNGLEAADAALRAEALVRISVLRQLAAKGKIAALIEWLDELREAEEKAVIFTVHRHIAEELAKRLDRDDGEFGKEVPLIHGGLPPEDRDNEAEDFKDDSNPFLVATIGAAGVGIDLTAASQCVFLESAWTPSQNDQAEGRLHRHGQTRKVTSWFIHGEDTVDSYIHEIVEKKRKIVSAVLGGYGDQFIPGQTDADAALEVARMLAAGAR